jgi:hypothetical protein
LPAWLAEWVEAQSTALQVPRELPALLSLAVLSTAVARRFEIKVRQGWIEPLNLYTLVALPSGTRKSVVFEAATAPLVAFEEAQAEEARFATAAIEDASSEARLRLVGDEEPLRRPSRHPRRVAGANEIHRSLCFVSDATPERVASLLAENNGQLAVLSDEGEICAIMAGRYGGSTEVFLKAYSGQVLTIERQGRRRVRVRRPALTLGLAVQPDVLAMLAEKRAVRERGLLARFILAMPPSNIGHRAIAPAPAPDGVINGYAERIRSLLKLEDRTDALGEIVPRVLTLSKMADRLFFAFESEVEAMLRPDGVLGAIPAWGAKLCGMVARVAGILWLGKHASAEAVPIDAVTMKGAIEIGRFAISHALAAFDSAGGDTDLASARVIEAWLGRCGKHEVTRREIHQALRGRFRKAVEIAGALALLEQYGYLRSVDRGAKIGRPSRCYAIHPSLLGG